MIIDYRPKYVIVCKIMTKACIMNQSSSLKMKYRILTRRLDIPTDVTMPNITKYMPPMMGVGMEAKRTPIFPITPIMNMRIALQRITLLLPTYNSLYKSARGGRAVSELF
jgi:hypothetical protein